ncbi:hypothetical protein BV25DRAFT_1610561 [Artomyces pyxidatus]|uniref:Uncharacterized protein n=1 Tax=Artomyces pyxidatus TaxID=48021 RepID=A0ACB8TC75_9AGAM|nr:hypothetical protein BV25DRAFT_1610561 [Artomyces pyxidatus]
MHLDHLLLPRHSTRGCITCPTSPPPCNCAANEQCFQVAQSCSACSSFTCVANDTGSGHKKGGVSTGAVAGAVVAVVIVLAVSVAAFLWWRRRSLARLPVAEPEVKDVPAPAETVLNRPNPTEKPSPSPTHAELPTVLRVYHHSSDIIDLDPNSRGASAHGSPASSHRDSIQSNPFGDGHSIQTTSTGSQSTNVIPIALVPPGTVSPHSPASQRNAPLPPMRPTRSPDVNLGMDHMNVSSDSNPGGTSLRSGISGVSSNNRHSYLTEASFASDVLTEAPTIVTQGQRQVLGVVKAEVVQAGSLPSTPTGSVSSRPPIRSPLAGSSFGPHDVVKEVDESQTLHVSNDPFSDARSLGTPGARSSMATLGTTVADHTVWPHQQHPFSSGPEPSSERPMSTYTQAASVIGADIMDATRVHLGFAQPTSASFVPFTPVASSIASGKRGVYQMTSGRLVTPSSGEGAADTLSRQQAMAMAEVQGHKAPNVEDQRMSMATTASGVSMRADSILESFTFVPPSPISNRPIRTPPRSPLAQESPVSQLNSGRQALSKESDASRTVGDRRTLGMSTGSQLSSMTTGLGSFPFQIDHGHEQAQSPPSNAVLGRQRASLDTLALTSDLSSYPLGFDRSSRDFTAFANGLKKA